jgi:DNA-directed RNA polymerase specialized sigma24 family protein
MKTLREAISTFNNWVSRSRAEKALATYYEMSKTQEGQKQILAAASSGDVVAADYLFLVYKKIIAKAFWTYYLGPQKQYHQKRLAMGADEDFASVAYSMLLGADGTSPYKTFNPEKFRPSADLIKQFGYYLYRYLQNEAVKMIRTEKMGGIAGNIPRGQEVSTVEYEDHFENTPQASSSDSFTGEVDMQETLKAFLQKLKQENTTYYNIFKARMQQKDFNTIAKELGMSSQSVRNHLKKIQQMYIEFTE